MHGDEPVRLYLVLQVIPSIAGLAVFPVCTGMNRQSRSIRRTPMRVPRMHGDEPNAQTTF